MVWLSWPLELCSLCGVEKRVLAIIDPPQLLLLDQDGSTGNWTTHFGKAVLKKLIAEPVVVRHRNLADDHFIQLTSRDPKDPGRFFMITKSTAERNRWSIGHTQR